MKTMCENTCGHNCHLLRSGVQCSPCQFKETQSNTKMKNILFTRTNNLYELGEITVLRMHFDSKKELYDYLYKNVKVPFVALHNYEECINNVNDEIEVITAINDLKTKLADKAIIVHIQPKKPYGLLGSQLERKATAILQ